MDSPSHYSSFLVQFESDDERNHRKRGPKRGRGANNKRKREEASEQELEAEVAYAIGLDAYGFNEGESTVLADDLEEEAYFQVRNHILARWRADVSRYLPEQEAGSRILPKHRHLVAAAWQFLDQQGHINWGVAPAVIGRPAEQHEQLVLIIGAGLAGLSAARQLLNHGYKVVVLEGADRPGGRVHTHRLQAGDVAGVADLGGSIITGIDGNPLAVIAKQLDIPLHDINSEDVPLYLRDGSELHTDVDAQVEQVFNQLLDRTADLRDQLGAAGNAVSLQSALDGLWQRTERDLQQEERLQQQQQEQEHPQHQHHHSNGTRAQQQHPQQPQPAAATLASQISRDEARHLLMQWHMANIEFANATRLRWLSMKHWDLDDAYEHQGAHVFMPGGNLRLLEGLAQGMPILYSAPVRLLQYSTSGVQAHTPAGVFVADAALVTVPLGVLKRPDGLVFQPPLPARKQQAIRRLGFGCLNKVMMLFPHCFWGNKDMFGHVRSDGQHRGLYYLFYAYNGIAGGAVLAALVAGDAAPAFEQLPEEQAVADVMQLLRGMFGPQGVTVPDPLQTVCTRWASDPMTYGSYSSVAVGSAGAADYEALATPLGNTVFFAGEATTSRYPATMHGAFATGMREAGRLMATFAARRGGGAMQAQALQQPMKRQASDPSPAAQAAAQQLASLPPQLDKLFQEYTSRVQQHCSSTVLSFGGFTAIFGPSGSPLQDTALLAISLDALRLKPRPAARRLYTTMPRAQLELLREVPGPDERRLGVLLAELGHRLTGRALDIGPGDLLRALVMPQQAQDATD